LLPGACGGAVWSILLWSAVSCPYPILREAHRNQFNPALEVAGSALGERPPSPLRGQKRTSQECPFLAQIGLRGLRPNVCCGPAADATHSQHEKLKLLTLLPAAADGKAFDSVAEQYYELS
jgi:hypothetical protein